MKPVVIAECSSALILTLRLHLNRASLRWFHSSRMRSKCWSSLPAQSPMFVALRLHLRLEHPECRSGRATSFVPKQEHPSSIGRRYDMRTSTRLWFLTFTPGGPHEFWRVD